MAPTRQPWDHWPEYGESAAEHSLFWRWVCAGANSRARQDVAKKFRLDISQVEAIARRNRWTERADAEAAHLRDVRMRAAEAEAEVDGRTVAAKALRLLNTAVDTAAFELEDLQRQQQVTGRGGMLTPREALRVALAGTRAARDVGIDVAAPGDPDVDLSLLSDAELEQWRALAGKARRRTG